MSSFEERQHPRAATGQFSDKAQGAPEVGLTAPGSPEARLAEAQSIADESNTEVLRDGGDVDKAAARGGWDKVTCDEQGTLRRFRDGKLHNDRGPAVETLDGDQEFRIDGKLHNPYGPTIVKRGGSVLAWHRQGKKVNAPPPAEQVVGYLAGGREDVFDAQWARHQAASHVGDDLAAVDAVHSALLDGYDYALIQARRAVEQAGTVR